MGLQPTWPVESCMGSPSDLDKEQGWSPTYLDEGLSAGARNWIREGEGGNSTPLTLFKDFQDNFPFEFFRNLL